eukprot:9483492-Pyramimonas_sp.AAC.1
MQQEMRPAAPAEALKDDARPSPARDDGFSASPQRQEASARARGVSPRAASKEAGAAPAGAAAAAVGRGAG